MKSVLQKLKTLHPSLHLALAALLFFLSVILSQMGDLLGWEESLFLAIYNWPEILRLPFIVITWFGSIQVFGAFTLLFLFLKKKNIVIRFIMTSALAYLLSGLGKSIWGRTRPNELLDIVARDFSYGPGFPSGHTALAVAMALTIGHYLPKKYHMIVVLWIVGVALSRIYLGIHAPLDIVGGFAIGWFSYMLVRHVRLTPVSFSKHNTSKEVTYTKKREKNKRKTS